MASDDLDPRSSIFQPSTQAIRWCKRLPLLLSCLDIALFLVLVCSFLGVHSDLGKKGRKEGGKERRKEGETNGWGGVEWDGMGWDGRIGRIG